VADDGFDPLAFKGWTPNAQEKALQRLAAAQNDRWRPFYCPNGECDGKPHDDWTWNHARADQRPPLDLEWLVWFLMGGRGSGKTRTGSEWVHRMADHVSRIALIAPTGADARDVMLEGESGILTISRPGNRPHYEPSKRRLTWPNGCVGTLYSAEEPDRLRGPEHGAAWGDEPAHWPQVQEAWDNLMFGLRLGATPRVCVTSTPKPRPWVKALVNDPRTRLVRVSTYANIDNLSPVFAERVIAKYEGTRLGRQELHGEILDDVEGALWSVNMIEDNRVAEAPENFDRVVIAVDPAGSTRKESDETGIIAVGVMRDERDHLYVLDDLSGVYTPNEWANIVMRAVRKHDADCIVAETNFGGDMVVETLRNVDNRVRVKKVRAKKAKNLRAEPVVGLYEQGRVHHVGELVDLETQMTEWVPFDGDSPDRVDALVYGCLELVDRAGPASIASPLRLVQGGRAS
jgi:phage terminase large subunit-like protein